MNCKFCNSNVRKLFSNGVECYKCQSVSVIEMPSSDEITEYYYKFNQNYTGGGSSDNQILYAKQYLKLVNKFNKNFKSLLDIGCSNSPFPNLAIGNGFVNLNVSVLDITEPKDLNPSIKFYKGLLDSGFSIPNNQKFDVITAWAVIEHVTDVDMSFLNISKTLNSGGYLFLTTPEIGTFLANYNLGKTPWFFPPEHLHILSAYTLENIANKHGMMLIKTGHFEISKFRYFIRYYLFGLFETLIGLPLYFLSKKVFYKLKDKRISSYKGIQYLIFKKK